MEERAIQKTKNAYKKPLEMYSPSGSKMLQ